MQASDDLWGAFPMGRMVKLNTGPQEAEMLHGGEHAWGVYEGSTLGRDRFVMLMTLSVMLEGPARDIFPRVRSALERPGAPFFC